MKFPDDVPTLTRGDITLRAHRIEDAEACVEQCVDPESVRWTTIPLDYTYENAVDWLTTSVPLAWEQRNEHLFAIETTHPDGRRRFSGSLSLRDEGEHRAELAFGAHPAVRGRGVMTTAVDMLLDYGFEQLGLETVIWWANRGNFASRRIAWKAGFTFGGTVPRWLPQRGDYLDGWVASLHRDDERRPTTAWFIVPVIEGDGVRLRPLHEGDVPRIVEACSDDDTRHWLSLLPSPYGASDAEAYLEATRLGASAGTWIQFAVADAESDILLASVGIPRIGIHGAEIGYWAHPESRGRGATTEGVRLLTRHALVDADDGGLGMHRLFIRAATDNVASRRVAEKNGYQQYAVERQAGPMRDGSYTDLVAYEMCRADWQADASTRRPVAQGV